MRSSIGKPSVVTSWSLALGIALGIMSGYVIKHSMGYSVGFQSRADVLLMLDALIERRRCKGMQSLHDQNTGEVLEWSNQAHGRLANCFETDCCCRHYTHIYS